MTATVTATVNDIAKIDPPRSWPKDHKFRFTQLPYDLQVYVAAHDKQRETTVRRAVNEAALSRNELAAIQKAPKATNKAKEKAA